MSALDELILATDEDFEELSNAAAAELAAKDAELERLRARVVELQDKGYEKVVEWREQARQMYFDDDGEGGRSDVVMRCADELNELLGLQ